MKRKIICVLLAVVLILNFGLVMDQSVVTAQSTLNWTAYNDCNFVDGDRDQNITKIGVSGTTSGTLIRRGGGAATPVTATFTKNGDFLLTNNGIEAVMGTDAYDTFSNNVSCSGVVNSSTSGWWVDLTLSGLDPAKSYTFAGTAIRGGGTSGYNNRNSTFILSGDEGATNASSTGTVVIDSHTIAFNTGGNNNEGYVVRWTDIDPGSDGTIVIRSRASSTSEIPGSTANAYALSVFMLQEREPAEPRIIISNTALEAFKTLPGETSSEQSYTVSGINLTDNIEITAPEGFVVSTTSGSGFGPSISLTPSSGTVTATEIFVRFDPADPGTFSGNITHTSTSAAIKTVAVSGTASSSLPPEYKGFSEAKSGTSGSSVNNVTSITVNKPASTDEGDLLVAGLTWDGNPGTITKPDGWEILNASGYPATPNVTTGVYYKIAGPGEPASYTWNWGTAESVYAFIICITGHDEAAPINVWSVNEGSSQSPSCPDVTTTVPDTLVLRIYGSDRASRSFSYPAGLTSITSGSSGSGSLSGETNGGAAYGVQEVAGPAGQAVFSLDIPGGNSAYRAFTIAIAPGAASDEPRIITSRTSLNAFSTEVGGPSAVQSYFVSGLKLTDSIEITAPEGFEVSAASDSGFGASISLTPSGGTVTATEVFVRFDPADPGIFSGNIIHTSTGAATRNVAVSGTAVLPGTWTAYNDCAYIDGQISTNITTYEAYTSGESGLLKKYADGSDAPVTVTVTTGGSVASQLTEDRVGSEANPDTDAYNIFHDYVNMVGGVRLEPGAYIDLSFTGLNQNNTYTFAATANRADPEYSDRITRFTISDVEAAVNGSTPGVTVSSNQSVSFCTGYNTINGYVARWTGIQPGDDGDFKVRVEIESGNYAYGPAVFLLSNETPGTVNHAPNQPLPVYPADGSNDISILPTLTVNVSDPDPDDLLDVTFYGREAGTTAPGPDFTLVAIPDTQMAAQSYPAVFQSQIQWIADNKDDLNIVFATNLGDLVNKADDATQWNNADAAYSKLEEEPGEGEADRRVPYSVAPGNHDLPWPPMWNTTLYPDYFGPERFADKSWQGWEGSFDDNNYDNYSFFSASGMDFIIVNLRYNAGTDVLNWADSVLKANPDRRAIVVQHDILNVNNSWSNQSTFNALKDNANLFLMLCGHNHASGDGAAYRAEQGDNGQTIHIMLADYQDFPNGGNGYLRLLRFSPADNTIYATTYSPTQDAYITTSPDQMDMAYTMSSTAPFEVIGTVSGISSGSNASISWPGREADTEYEWYVEVSDGSRTTTGPVWTFTTGGVSSPAIIQGTTFNAMGEVLGGVTLTLDDGTQVVSGADGSYQLTVATPGTYTLTASKAGYLDEIIEDIEITPGESYTIDFKGNTSLIPSTLDINKFLACVNKWQVPPSDGTGLGMEKILKIINIWITN